MFLSMGPRESESGTLKFNDHMLQPSMMNFVSRPALSGSFFLLLFGLLLSGNCSMGADVTGVARATGLLGRARVAREGGALEPLQTGARLRVGDVIETASNSALDIHLGPVIGTVRLTQNSTLALEQVSIDGNKFEVQLALRRGELLGNPLSIPAGSRLEVKVSNGIAQLLGGRFRVDSLGRVVLIEGKAFFAHVPAGGEAAVHAMTAPPAVFFSPASGVKPAPKELKKEVMDQLKSKLPRD